MAVIVAVIGIASFGASVWASRSNPTTAFFAIQCRFWELGAGVLLFQLSNRVSTVRDPNVTQRKAMLQKIGLALVLSAALLADAGNFPFPWAVPVVLGTSMMLGSVDTESGGSLRRLLTNRFALWTGKRSYSLYLWHWPIFVLMRWTVGLESIPQLILAIVLTFGAAATSYRIIELPLRHNRRIQSFRPALQIGLFLALIGAGRKLTHTIFSQRQNVSLSTITRHWSDWAGEGDGAFTHGADTPCSVVTREQPLQKGSVLDLAPTHCNSPRRIRRLFVLGDSHAGMYRPLFKELSSQEGISVRKYSLAGCPYLPLVKMQLEQTPECVTFVRAASKQVLDLATPGDVLFLPSLRLSRLTDQWARSKAREELLNESGDSTQQGALREAKRLLEPFFERHLNVLFAAPTPVFRAPPFRCSD